MKEAVKKRFDLGHAGQIVTTRKTIVDFIRDIRQPVAYNTVYLISDGLIGSYGYLRLYSACARLYYLSRLVYAGKDGTLKLKAGQYRKEIFEPYVETPEEVRDILERRKAAAKESVNDNHVDQVFRCLKIIETLWSTSIACVHEQTYIPELAYAFEYVVQRIGELPEPEFEGEWSMFPRNYENYNYIEGIAEYFEDVMVSII